MLISYIINYTGIQNFIQKILFFIRFFELLLEKVGIITTTKNTTIIIPEHYIPSFKPAKSFANNIKKNLK